MNDVTRTLIGVAIGLLVAWLALVVTLLAMAHDRVRLSDAVRLWLLAAYLALPIDLVPDFVPVIGYADDAVVTMLVLRSVVHRAGPEAIARHWPGTPDGLTAVQRLTQ